MLKKLNYKTKPKNLPYQKIFDEKPHELKVKPQYKFYRHNLADFLNKKNISTVLEINCDTLCHLKYKKNRYYKKLNAEFEKPQKNEYQWLNIHNDGAFPRNILTKLRKYLPLSTEGVTLIFKNMNELF